MRDLAFKHKVFLENLGIDYNNYLFVGKGLITTDLWTSTLSEYMT